MAILYGVTTGQSLTSNFTNEMVAVQGAKGTVVSFVKKYRRTEITKETLPDSLSIPSLATVPTWIRFEVRMSNTDFARQFETTVTYNTIS
jgi:hypothetical protein